MVTDANSMVMPVGPMYGNGGGGMFGGNNGDWGWIVLLLLLGWNNNGFGGNGGGNNLYPWMNQLDATTAGFQNAQLASQLSSIQSSVNGISNQLCNSFAAVESGANARQMANMQQMFDLSTQFGNCCCENRLATANLNTAIAQAANSIIQNQNAGVQAIKDQMCQDKLETKDDIIAQLRSELMYARGQASQDVQTAAIQAGQRALANEVEQYVLPTPRPAYIVQNPNCCQQYGSCAYGM
jgi:hypothetical protein